MNLEAVALAFLLKFRGFEFRALALARERIEPVLVGLAQGDDGLLRGALGHLQHPGELLALERVELAPQGALMGLGQGGVLPVRFVLGLPLRQRPVVGEAGHAAALGEVGGLRLIGVEPDFMATENGQVMLYKSALGQYMLELDITPAFIAVLLAGMPDNLCFISGRLMLNGTGTLPKPRRYFGPRTRDRPLCCIATPLGKHSMRVPP